jgi:cytochrome c-type biogenesis protein CcmH/NrfF
MMRRIFLFLPMIFLSLGVISAQDSDDALIKDLEQSLMAPCCWSGTVFDHGHTQMEEEIESFVKAGKSKDEILAHFVEQYGEKILAAPVAKGFNLFAWIAPLMIAGIGVFILVMFIRNPKSSGRTTAKDDKEILFDKEIEKELKEFDS